MQVLVPTVPVEVVFQIAYRELNEAIMNYTKPNSAPGIDWFTVKFIRDF